MALVDADGGSLQADSLLKSVAQFEGQWPTGTECMFIKWTRWSWWIGHTM